MTRFTRLRSALLALALLVLTAAAASADTAISLFVGKSEVKGVVHGGKVYVPAEEMLKAMGYTWTAGADGYTLQPGKAAGPTIGVDPHFTLSGRSAAPASMKVKGRTWIDAAAMTQGLGGFYLFTPSVGIAQASFPARPITEADLTKAVKQAKKDAKQEEEEAARRHANAWKSGTGNSSSSSSSSESGSSSGDSEKTKSTKGAAPGDDEPIAVDRVSFSTLYTGVMRGKVVLRNDAEVPIRNVFVHITMQAPDEPTAGPKQYASGAGGSASLPSYVKDTNDGSLPTYGGTPPTSASAPSYPDQASMSAGPSPSPTPASTTTTAAATPTASPEASPTPPPMHTVATLPALFVAEIQPGKTLEVPFEWANSQHVHGVTPTVQTQHEKVEFTRKKEKKDDEEESGDDKKTGDDKSGDKKSGDDKSGDKKTDDGKSTDKKTDDGKSTDKKADDGKSTDKKTDNSKSTDKKADAKSGDQPATK